MLFRKLVVATAAGAFLLVMPHTSWAQATPDTLHVSLEQTEALFLQNNLQLLASHYNVRADSALIRQARLWDNPTLTVDQNVYANNRFFQHGVDETGNPTGQFYVQVQQLIQLGNKRRRAIEVSQATAGIAQLQFEETMRTLRQTLRKDFYTMMQLQRYASLYGQELSEISKLTDGMIAQYQAGNIAHKDLLRVQAVLVGLQQEQVENARALEDVQNELRTMLSITNGAYIQPDGMRLSVVPALPSQSIPELIEIARAHNPTYLIAAQQVASQKLNYQYQKALTVPDLNVGPNFDRASNFTPNYVGLTLSIPIPLFNRNQGNIRSAAFNIQQQETLLASEDITLRNGVQSAYRKLALAISITGPATTAFYNDYRQLFNNIIQSYRARQISLVEFIDYLNGYEDIREKQLQQQLNIQLAKEELNYVVGIDAVK